MIAPSLHFAHHLALSVDERVCEVKGRRYHFSKSSIISFSSCLFQVGVANIIWHQTFGRTLPYDDPLLERVKDLAKEVSRSIKYPFVFFSFCELRKII